MDAHRFIEKPLVRDWLYLQLIWEIDCLLHRRRPSASRNKVDNIRGLVKAARGLARLFTRRYGEIGGFKRHSRHGAPFTEGL